MSDGDGGSFGWINVCIVWFIVVALIVLICSCGKLVAKSWKKILYRSVVIFA